MFKQFNSLKLVRGMLYREVVVDNQKKTQLVLPSSYVESVLKGLHNDMGHPTLANTGQCHCYVIGFSGQECSQIQTAG